MWVTFTYATACVNGMFLAELQRVVDAIRTHAREYWPSNPDAVAAIRPHKIDVAVDLQGSLLARDPSAAQETLQGLLGVGVDALLASADCNFLGLYPILGLGTIDGENILNSCLQFAIKDQTGEKILNIKAYDKVLDLVGREATYLVSSRVNTILGNKYEVGVFERQLRKQQHVGMTRLELSICHSALEKFSPWAPSVRTLWHQKVTKFAEEIIGRVLNDERALSLVYRRISVPRLIANLLQCDTNILAVGRRHTWIINARTAHKKHFVGTRAVAGISTRSQCRQQINRVQNLVLRHASVGAIIDVYWLEEGLNTYERLCTLRKECASLVQAPGCTLQD